MNKLEVLQNAKQLVAQIRLEKDSLKESARELSSYAEKDGAIPEVLSKKLINGLQGITSLQQQFISNYTEVMDSAIYQQTFTFTDGVLDGNEPDYRFIPVRVTSAQDYNNYQPTPYEDPDEIARIIAKIKDLTAEPGIPLTEWSSGQSAEGNAGSQDTSASASSETGDTTEASDNYTDAEYSDDTDGYDGGNYDEDYDYTDEEDGGDYDEDYADYDEEY